MTALRWLLSWLTGVATVALLGSIIQTQLNLARIAELDGAVPFSLRLETTLFDLVSFAPTWAVVMALGMVVATVVAGALSRYWPHRRTALYVLAGFSAVAVAIAVMNAMLPVTVIAAARTWTGFVLLCLAGALAGWVHLAVATAGYRRAAGTG